jgi:hypothetical protein
MDASLTPRLPRVYWINLDRAVGRRERMCARLDGRALAHERVAAVDGRDAGATARAIRAGAPPAAEAAGIASHLTAVRLAHARGEERAIVMEDDTTFDLYDAWPDGYDAIVAELPPAWSAVALCIAEFPRHLDRLFRRRGLVHPLGARGYWSVGAYLLHRRGMAALLERYDRGDHFDVTGFRGYCDAYHVVMRTLQRAGVPGPFVSRVPLFLYEGEDSDLHPEELGEHRVARDFIRVHHAALVRGDYRSPFGLRARLRRWGARVRPTRA